MRTSGLARLIGLCFGLLGLISCQAEPNRAAPPYALISVKITPGKPDAPTEVVQLAQDGEKCELTVKRLDPDGKALEQQTVALPPAAFNKVWDYAEDHKLRKLTLPAKKSGVDFGLRQLRFEWKSAPADVKPSEHQLSWTASLPKPEEEKLSGLLSLLAGLAKKHATKVQLYYFPTE